MNSIKQLFLWAALIVLAAAILVGRGGKSDPAHDPRFVSAEELDKLPVGIKVSNDPKLALASRIDNPTTPANYRWWYKTTVAAIDAELTIVEFGALEWRDDKWVTGGTISGNPYTGKNLRNGIRAPMPCFGPVNPFPIRRTGAAIQSFSLARFVGTTSVSIATAGGSKVKRSLNTRPRLIQRDQAASDFQ